MPLLYDLLLSDTANRSGKWFDCLHKLLIITNIHMCMCVNICINVCYVKKKDQRGMGTIHGQQNEERYMRGNIRTCDSGRRIK